ncbi:MAG: AarF/ABC1/UbiB kinase family protein [Clostridiales bacterium]|jgi:ubiquinone biosynthesis protein|nr:AarF/ABC1/UbiB kinase family protein [Clostridiales bacterium]
MKKADKPSHRERKKRADSPSVSRLKEMLGVLRRYDVMHGVSPEKLRLILEDMGPTYVKLGQIMSMRSDILPQDYCDQLARLRADVKPMPFSQVQKVVEQEYGASIQGIFSSVDPEPLGAASIAQVHAAVLKDKRRVVIKVQRPGIRETMAQDINLMRKAVRILKAVSGAGDTLDFAAIIDEMWQVAQQEMNFLLEADHIEEFSRRNETVEYVACPQVDSSLTTSRVLVMEYVDGVQVDDVDELKKRGYDVREIGAKLAENYCKQVLDDAFFHADPHPGNIWIREGKIVWLDLGMMGRLTRRDKHLFRAAIRAVVNNDVYELKNIVLTLGVVRGRVNHARLYTDLDDMLLKYGDLDLGSINLGQMVQELLELAKNHGIGMPAGVTMLGRGVMTIEGVLAACCPDISFLKIVSAHLAGEAVSDFDLSKELRHKARALYNLFSKGIEIPAHLDDVLKMTVKGQTKLNLELTGSEEPLGNIDRMVNKIIVCIITAALLISSSTICTTDMSPKMLGIPILGALGYLAALFLGGWLLFHVLRRKK